MKSPKEIVDIMLSGDYFSQWMGLEIIDLGLGNCKLKCTTKKDMLNGFEILHGGITYSLSDSALAFASNSYGYKCVSIETSISHLRQVKVNEPLTITCEESYRGKTIGLYFVNIVNAQGQLVSRFKGTVHISSEVW